MLTYSPQDLTVFIIAGLAILLAYYLCVIKNNFVTMVGVITAAVLSFFPIFFANWSMHSGYLSGYIKPAGFVLFYPIFLYLFYTGQRGKKRALVSMNRNIVSVVQILAAALFVVMLYVLIAIPFDLYAFSSEIRGFLTTGLWWLCCTSILLNLLTGFFADATLYVGMFMSSFLIRRYLLVGVPNSIIIDIVSKILVPFYVGVILFLLFKYVLGLGKR